MKKNIYEIILINSKFKTVFIILIVCFYLTPNKVYSQWGDCDFYYDPNCPNPWNLPQGYEIPQAIDGGSTSQYDVIGERVAIVELATIDVTPSYDSYAINYDTFFPAIYNTYTPYFYETIPVNSQAYQFSPQELDVIDKYSKEIKSSDENKSKSSLDFPITSKSAIELFSVTSLEEKDGVLKAYANLITSDNLKFGMDMKWNREVVAGHDFTADMILEGKIIDNLSTKIAFNSDGTVNLGLHVGSDKTFLEVTAHPQNSSMENRTPNDANFDIKASVGEVGHLDLSTNTGTISKIAGGTDFTDFPVNVSGSYEKDNWTAGLNAKIENNTTVGTQYSFKDNQGNLSFSGNYKDPSGAFVDGTFNTNQDNTGGFGVMFNVGVKTK